MAKTEVKLTHPLANTIATVSVRLTTEFRLRLWLTRQLLRLAIGISGGRVVFNDDDTESSDAR
jgi:hypothetical protein